MEKDNNKTKNNSEKDFIKKNILISILLGAIIGTFLIVDALYMYDLFKFPKGYPETLDAADIEVFNLQFKGYEGDYIAGKDTNHLLLIIAASNCHMVEDSPFYIRVIYNGEEFSDPSDIRQQINVDKTYKITYSYYTHPYDNFKSINLVTITENP